MNKQARLVFLISLVINIVLTGILLGQWFSPAAAPDPQFSLVKMLENSALPEAKKASLRAKIEDITRQHQEGRKNIAAEREKVLQLMVAEPFDEAAYRAQMDNMLALRSLQRQQMADIIKTTVTQSDTQERAALADMLRQIFKKKSQ